jgi:hypothetical protein
MHLLSIGCHENSDTLRLFYAFALVRQSARVAETTNATARLLFAGTKIIRDALHRNASILISLLLF